jgi:CheY-like chemotaxis protein
MKRPVAWRNKPLRRLLLRRALARLLSGDATAVTEFQLRALAEEDQTPEGSSQKPPIGSVLVVEDNPVNREVVGAMLGKLGVTVHNAGNGMEALQWLTTGNVAAVLMDCQMPELDGYETTRRLREWELVETRPRTPVVALTANALAGDAEKCLAAGMDFYLSKPFSLEELRAVLGKCVVAAEPKVDTGQARIESEQPRVESEQPNGQSSVESGPGPETLDMRVLERIRQLGGAGAPDLLSRLTRIYATNSAQLVETLRVAARTGDDAALGQAAHALKSSSANVGATNLATICGDLESAAQEGNSELTTNLLHQLVAEHRRVLRELKGLDKNASVTKRAS